MKKYIVLENLSNGMKKNDKFIQGEFMSSTLAKLLAKGRVKEVIIRLPRKNLRLPLKEKEVSETVEPIA